MKLIKNSMFIFMISIKINKLVAKTVFNVIIAVKYLESTLEMAVYQINRVINARNAILIIQIIMLTERRVAIKITTGILKI